MFPTPQELQSGWAKDHRVELFRARLLVDLPEDPEVIQIHTLKTAGGMITQEEAEQLKTELQSQGWVAVGVMEGWFFLSTRSEGIPAFEESMSQWVANLQV